MVLRETLAAVLASILLVAVSMYIDAPLESIADPSTSTNPSKAPWYFLGLQELLVYFPPWIAGVLIPSLILVCLAAIPYLDLDVTGPEITDNARHPLAKLLTGLFTGGMVLWILLTLIGLFLRGPNWQLQRPDGTPLGAGAAAGPLGWLVPSITGVYVLILLLRLPTHREHINKLGTTRWFTVQAMVLGGLIVILTISVQMCLSL